MEDEVKTIIINDKQYIRRRRRSSTNANEPTVEQPKPVREDFRMKITIHRGTHQIGGCVTEYESNG